jgi:hypothetical protein
MTEAAGRSRGAAARTYVARAIAIVAGIVVALIVLGILLAVLEANPDNVIVGAITDVARTLVGPFENLFTLKEQKAETAVNWGIAALVYLLIGQVLARLVAP